MHKASVEERLKLKRIQIDTWSTREQLCLASSVLRSGDQNWVSVSRSVRLLGDPGRPHDWFSQKNCALQYDSLLENAGTPKRKRGEKGEEAKPTTPGECIVQKLTMERIDELKKLLAQHKEKYKKLKEDVIELSSGRADHRLGEISQQLEEEKKQKELEQLAHERRLKEREEKINEIQRAFRPQAYHLMQRKAVVPVRPAGTTELPVSSDTEISQDSPLNEHLNVDQVLAEETPVKTSEEKPASTPTSPLLTSLLKSPSPAPSAQASILHTAITSQRAPTTSTAASATPTISSLLASSPIKREGSVSSSAFSPGLSQLVTSAISTAAEVTQTDEQPKVQTLPSTSPSAGAPTLSMLLELPPTVPGTPLPELPGQSTVTPKSESMLVPGQLEQQVADIVTPGTGLPVEFVKEETLGIQGTLETEQIPLTHTTEPSTAVPEVLVLEDESPGKATSTDIELAVAIKQEELIPEAPQIATTVQTPPVPMTVLDATMDATQLDKIVTEMKAEERTADQAESILEELPQEVVALIEEVEMAEEAEMQKQMQQQQQQQPQPQKPVEPTRSQPEEMQMKIQEIQQQLVASTPEVPEIINEPEIVVSAAVPPVIPEPPSVTESVETTEIVEETVAPTEEKEKEQPEPEKPTVTEELSQQAEVVEEEIKPVQPSEPEKEEPIPCEVDISDTISPEIEQPEEPKEKLEEQEKVVEVEQESIVAEATPVETENLEVQEPEVHEVEEETKEVEEIPEKEQTCAEDVAKEDDESAQSLVEKEIGVAPPSPPPTVPVQAVPKETEIEEVEEEEPEEEELPPQQQLTLTTPITTRRRHALPTSTPSTPIDSLPNSPASVGISATDEDKEYRIWKKAILLIWSRLAAHKNASIFTKPITNEMAPGYHNVVFRPMDLTTIKKNIETGQIRTTYEFQRDIMLMFTNAIMYNASDHEVPKMAQEMQKDCLNSIQMFLTAQESSNALPLRRETREMNKRHDSSYLGDGDDSEASRSTAPSPLPLKRKRTATINTPSETKKRRPSIVP